MLTGEAPFLADSIHGIMYQILNFTPPAPSVKNHELPEMVDLIAAKALGKNVEERYQSAREFADDLKNCRDLLMGKQSVPAGLRDTSPGAPPAPSGTRKQDRLDALKAAPAGVTEPDAGKGLALAKSFDSYEATLRLASLTGMDDAEKTQKLAAGEHAAPDTPNLPPAAESVPPAQPAPRARSYAHLYLFSAIALAAAAALYFLA
jgi:serine/threonine-protein kinase